MKNQLDLIIVCASVFFAAVFALVFMETRRQITKPSPPPTVNVAPVALPGVAVSMATALPAGSSSGSRGGGGGAAAPPPGRGGAPAGPNGAYGGMSGPGAPSGGGGAGPALHGPNKVGAG
jgi:hypothetical protein